MPNTYPKASPYYKTPMESDYIIHLGIYKDRAIEANENDLLIEIEDRHLHRPDLLSQELYGTTKYWWVFTRRNMNVLRDPIWDMEPGLEIYVPSKTYLQQILG